MPPYTWFSYWSNSIPDDPVRVRPGPAVREPRRGGGGPAGGGPARTTRSKLHQRTSGARRIRDMASMLLKQIIQNKKNTLFLFHPT